MFNLGQYLPYLINRAGVRVATRFTQDLRPHDVSLQEWRVLAALTCYGAQRMSELAGLTSIDRTTLSRLVTRMEAANLVARSRREEDGREVHIGLSDKGGQAAKEIIPLAEHYEKVALEGFSTEEEAQLKAMLQRVFTNLGKL